MSEEAIVIPIIIDPKAGVAGLKAVGDEAKRNNDQFNNTNSSGAKFGDTMKRLASNGLQLLGAMNLVEHGIKFVAAALIESIFATDKLASSKKMLAEISTKAAASTRDEVIQLQLLFTTAKNTALAEGQRQAAIDKLNKSYPELHKNITLENIGTAETARLIGSVIDNLVKKAQLQGTISQIAELSNKVAAMQSIIDKGAPGIVKDRVLSDIKEANERIQELTKSAEKLQASVLVPDEKKNIGDLIGGDVKEIKPPKIKISPKKVEIKPDRIDFLFDGAIGSRQDFLSKLLPTDTGGLGKFFQKLQADIDSNRKFDLKVNLADSQGKGFSSQLEKGLKTYNELLAKGKQVAEQVSNLLTPAFDSFIDAIVSKQDAIKAFFTAIGSSIKQLMKQLVQAAIQAAVLSLITGGSAKGGLSFSKAFGKAFGFADGGLVTGPVSALVGEGAGTNKSNPEVVAPLDKLKNFFAGMLNANKNFSAGSSMGTAGMNLSMPREVKLFMDGKDVRGILSLVDASQKRTA